MKPDESMIGDAIAGLRGGARMHMLDLADKYRAACDLASKPNPVRARYWQEKAARMAIYIKRATENRMVPEASREQRV